MKKIIVLALALVSFTVSKAQVGEGTNWLKAGIHAGIPVGDMSEVSSFALGLDLKYQFLNAESFAIGVSTGFTNYFGKTEGLIEYNDLGVIPVAGLFRFYPTENFFLGTDVGYAFLTEEVVTTDGSSSGGFYYRPEIGYHNDSWNIFAFYQGVVIDGFSPASVGVGINYNIIQGQ